MFGTRPNCRYRLREQDTRATEPNGYKFFCTSPIICERWKVHQDLKGRIELPLAMSDERDGSWTIIDCDRCKVREDYSE